MSQLHYLNHLKPGGKHMFNENLCALQHSVFISQQKPITVFPYRAVSS
jgi:hypothetical protein